jgi:hypothetical protein
MVWGSVVPDGWTRWMSWLILRKIVVSGFLVMLLLMSIHVYLPIFFDISLLNQGKPDG